MSGQNCRFGAAFLPAVLSLLLINCGGSDSDSGSGSTPTPTPTATSTPTPTMTATPTPTPTPTSEFTISVEVPDSLESQLLAVTPTWQQKIANFFIAAAYADDITADLLPEDFRVVVINPDGSEEDLTAQAQITQNSDGTYSVIVPGDPRVDCIIIADLANDVELFAPTTALEVQINPVTTYAYQQVLNRALADPAFTWTDFSNQEIEAYVDEVEAAIEAQGGVDALTFSDIDELLDAIDTEVDDIAEDLIDDIELPQASNEQLTALAGDYALIDFSVDVFSFFASNDVIISTVVDTITDIEATVNDDNGLDFTFTGFDEFETRLLINASGFANVSQDADVDGSEVETLSASVNDDLGVTLVLPAEEEIEVEEQAAFITLPSSIAFRASNEVLVGTSMETETAYNLVDGEADLSAPTAVDIVSSMSILVKRPETMTAADIAGNRYGFVDKFFYTGETGQGTAVFESGIGYGTVDFTATDFTVSITESYLEVAADGSTPAAPTLDDSEDGTETLTYNMASPGFVTATSADNDTTNMYVSPDEQMVVGFTRELGTNDGGGDIFLGVALPQTAVNADALAGKTFDLVMMFNLMEGGYIGLHQFPSLTLSFDAQGGASLAGVNIFKEFAFPPPNDLSFDNFIAEGAQGIDAIDPASFSGTFTVDENGKFTVNIEVSEGGEADILKIDGYIQDGASTIVGALTLVAPGDPDPFLDNGLFAGYLQAAQ